MARKRVLQVHAAQPSQEHGRFLLPGTTATLGSTVTTRAAGALAFVNTSFSCRPSAPAPLQSIDVRILQVHGSRVWTSSNQVSFNDPDACDGAVHSLRIDVPASKVPFATGRAFVLVSDVFPVPTAPANPQSLVWSPVAVVHK